MMVDDAHASGVFGKNGRGTIDHFGLHGRVDVQVGTLSKAIGALGGYVAGSRSLIEFLHHRGRPFLFSTSHPPSVVATCLAALDVLLEEPQLIDQLWANTKFFKEGLQALGFNTGASESPITPVIVGEAPKAMKLSDRLFEEGVFAQGIGFPTVARDKARVRTIVTATHTRDGSPVCAGCIRESRQRTRADLGGSRTGPAYVRRPACQRLVASDPRTWSNTSVRAGPSRARACSCRRHANAQTVPVPNDGVSRVMREIERVLTTCRSRVAYAPCSRQARTPATEFLEEWLQPGVTRAVVQERLRAEIPDVAKGLAYDVYVDVLTEFGRNRAGSARCSSGCSAIVRRRRTGALRDSTC